MTSDTSAETVWQVVSRQHYFREGYAAGYPSHTTYVVRGPRPFGGSEYASEEQAVAVAAALSKMTASVDHVPHKDDVLREQSWDAFRSSGMLWFANRILHVFGWAIVVEHDDDLGYTRERAYPARTKWRGFAPDREALGFQRVTEYMQRTADELRKELDE